MLLPTPPHVPPAGKPAICQDGALLGTHPSATSPLIPSLLIFNIVPKVWLQPEMGFLHFYVTQGSSPKQVHRIIYKSLFYHRSFPLGSKTSLWGHQSEMQLLRVLLARRDKLRCQNKQLGRRRVHIPDCTSFHQPKTLGRLFSLQPGEGAKPHTRRRETVAGSVAPSRTDSLRSWSYIRRSSAPLSK